LVTWKNMKAKFKMRNESKRLSMPFQRTLWCLKLLISLQLSQINDIKYLNRHNPNNQECHRKVSFLIRKRRLENNIFIYIDGVFARYIEKKFVTPCVRSEIPHRCFLPEVESSFRDFGRGSLSIDERFPELYLSVICSKTRLGLKSEL